MLSNNNLRLFSRNEGKLKSYQSCSDVRAWSHDLCAQDRYLREWMKKDMPVCVIPISTITGILRIMTCKSRRRVTPRCHPDCKSKVILESICASCIAMKESLRDQDTFDEYFVEDELESSHWPCDKCLDALKSIKLFWKIILGKVININSFKFENISNNSSRCDNVKSVVQLWENEMLKQALYVKNMNKSPLKRNATFTKVYNPKEEKAHSQSVKSCPVNKNQPYLIKTTISARPDPEGPSKLRERRVSSKKSVKKLNKTTNTDVKVSHYTNVSCSFSSDSDEIKDYKKNIEVLQNKCKLQNEEMERLRKENKSLMIELNNVYKAGHWRAKIGTRIHEPDKILLPNPFEAGLDEKTNDARNADSEMIITMKNCRNDYFKHVSVLQVLHKTNDPLKENFNQDGPSEKKDDPLEILTRVQNTFGAIVRREIGIINEKRTSSMDGDVIEGSYHKVVGTRSESSCSVSSKSFEYDSGTNIVLFKNGVGNKMFGKVEHI